MRHIKKAESGQIFRDFLNVPKIVYQGNPHFISQLNLERRLHFSKQNPYFKHAQACFWVAYDGHQPIGRISAQIDTLAQKNDGIITGHFGCLDCVDKTALNDLLQTAENWLSTHGVQKIIGPFSLSINDESGLLVDGFQHPPVMMMNYAHGWYGTALEDIGYNKAKDLLAFRLEAKRPLPLPAQRMAEKGLNAQGLVERALDPKNLIADLKAILNIFNTAWAENWGFVKMTSDEIIYTAKNMKPLIIPEFTRLVEINGAPAAMIVALPNLNEAIADFEGHLLPFNWLKLIWRLKKNRLKTGRVLLMGVLPEYQKTFLGSSMAVLLIANLRQAMLDKKYEEAEMSWILEDNLPIIRLIENVGGQAYKRYRLFEKNLS